jgi:hypothetical protein
MQKRRSNALVSGISDEARGILDRVGLALIIFGVLDIGVMIYSIVNSVNYSSSFNLFAVLAGVYVRRGHPWWVKWTTRAAGFYAAAFCTMVPMFAFLLPMDFVAIELRLHPVAAIAGAILTLQYSACHRASVIIHNLRILRSGVSPAETQTPLVVDADAVLTRAIPDQDL